MKTIKIGTEYGISLFLGSSLSLEYEGEGHVGYYFSQTAPSDTSKFWVETNADGSKKYPFAWVYDPTISGWVSEVENFTESSFAGIGCVNFCSLYGTEKVRRITGYTLNFVYGSNISNFVLASIRLSDDFNDILKTTPISNKNTTWQTLSFADYNSRDYIIPVNCLGLAKLTNSSNQDVTSSYASLALKYRIVR